MRPEPHDAVMAWVAAQRPSMLNITAITLGEIMRGLKRLPLGKRRKSLEQQFNQFIAEAFVARILPFDTDAAQCYGEITLVREQRGGHVDAVDMMIAAIAHTHSAAIATRNIKDFTGCGLRLIDPWTPC